MKVFAFFILFTTTLFSSDVTVKESCLSVEQTVEKLQSIIKSKGLSIFGVIDHTANAKNVSMELQDAKLIIFGNPKLGTKLMQKDITAGLDLPLKIFVYKESDQTVKIAYRDGDWLATQYSLDLPQQIAKINKAMDNFTTKAGQCKKD